MLVSSASFTPKYSAVLFKIYLWELISPSLGISKNNSSYKLKKSSIVTSGAGGVSNANSLNWVLITLENLLLL